MTRLEMLNKVIKDGNPKKGPTTMEALAEAGFDKAVLKRYRKLQVTFTSPVKIEEWVADPVNR